MHITEVSPKGEIVWELTMNDDKDYYYRGFKVERYYSSPLIKLESNSLFYEEGDTASFKVNVWNTVKLKQHSNGNLKLMNGTEELFNLPFQFKPYWQKNELQVSTSKSLPPGTYNLDLVLTNNEGLKTIQPIQISITGKITSNKSSNSTSTSPSTTYGFDILSFITIFSLFLVNRRIKSGK